MYSTPGVNLTNAVLSVLSKRPKQLAPGLLVSVLFTLALLVPGTVMAQLQITEPVIEMHDNEARRQVKLYNSGDLPVTIVLDLQEVLSPATSDFNNEITAPANRVKVRVKPELLEIPPHQSAHITVHQSVRQLSNDEAYRLLIKPLREVRPSGENILLNYDLLLLIRPQKALPKISMLRTADGVALTNVGNSNALVSSMTLCDESSGACEVLGSERLYADEKWLVPIPSNFDINHVVLSTEQQHRQVRKRIEYHTKYLKAR